MFEGWSRHNTTAVLNGSLVALVAEGELPQTAQSGLSMQARSSPTVYSVEQSQLQLACASAVRFCGSDMMLQFRSAAVGGALNVQC